MSDNQTLPVSGGATFTVAADEVTDGTLGTVKVQYTKIMDGTLDGTAKVAVTANGLNTYEVDPVAVTGSISVVDAGSTTATGFNGESIVSGTPTVSSFVVASFTGENTTSVSITGSFIGTLIIERSTDGGVTFKAATFTSGGTPFSSVVSTTATGANGIFMVNSSASTSIRVRASARTSGTANVVIQSGTGVSPVHLTTPVLAQYNSIAPTPASGSSVPLQTNASGALLATLASLIAGEDLTNNVLGVQTKPIVGSQYAPGTYQMPSTAVTKANIKSAAGNVSYIRVSNEDPAPRWFQLHNTASAPVAGATPQLKFEIPAGTTNQPSWLTLTKEDFGPSEYFSTGIGFAISTTRTTFTDSASASEHTDLTVRYV